MNSDLVFFIGIALLFFLFAGSPDVTDAITERIESGTCEPAIAQSDRGDV